MCLSGNDRVCEVISLDFDVGVELEIEITRKSRQQMNSIRTVKAEHKAPAESSGYKSNASLRTVVNSIWRYAGVCLYFSPC